MECKRKKYRTTTTTKMQTKPTLNVEITLNFSISSQ